MGSQRLREAPVDAALATWGERWLARRPAGSNARLYVGFSGGLDSVVLLHATWRWLAERVQGGGAGERDAQAAAVTLVPVHINHGVAAAAEHWAQHCCTFSAGLGLRCQVFHAPPLDAGRGFEARARAARYGHFSELLDQPADSLLLAHHRDDQSETLLLRLFQGRGLLPIPGRRPLGAGTLERPLLRLERNVLATYAERFELPAIEDPGNADTQHERNYLRHVVLPRVRERWPQADQALDRVAARSSEAQRLLEQLLGQRAALEIEELTGELALPLLRAWLHARGEHRAADRALEEFLRQLASPVDRAPELRLPGGCLRRRGQTVIWEPASD
ncbi:MAG: tRNA lysidine(34) synthetase TilS [Pseudomonadota bacterium]